MIEFLVRTRTRSRDPSTTSVTVAIQELPFGAILLVLFDWIGGKRYKSLALEFPDQGPLEFCEGPQDRQHQIRQRGVLTGEAHVFLGELGEIAWRVK